MEDAKKLRAAVNQTLLNGGAVNAVEGILEVNVH